MRHERLAEIGKELAAEPTATYKILAPRGLIRDYRKIAQELLRALKLGRKQHELV